MDIRQIHIDIIQIDDMDIRKIDRHGCQIDRKAQLSVIGKHQVYKYIEIDIRKIDGKTWISDRQTQIPYLYI